MKKYLIILSMLILVLTGCDSNKESNEEVKYNYTLEQLLPYINGDIVNYESLTTISFTFNGDEIINSVSRKHDGNYEYTIDTTIMNSSLGVQTTVVEEYYTIYGLDKDTIYTKKDNDWVESYNTENPGQVGIYTFDLVEEDFELKNGTFRASCPITFCLIKVDLMEGIYTISVPFSFTIEVSNINNVNIELPF